MGTIIKLRFSVLVMFFAALAAVSCTDDNGEKTPKLSVDRNELTVPAEGGVYEVKVTSENVALWDFSCDSEWVVCSRGENGETGKGGDGLMTVTVSPNGTDTARSAVVTLHASGAEDAAVTVHQAAAAEPTAPEDAKVIWDNNSRFFAKLSGTVASVDFVEDMSNIKLVEFDREGYVTRMTTDIEGSALVTTYEYDSQKRLRRVDFLNSAGQGIGMSIVVNYTEAHANYIDIGHSFLNGLEFVKAFQPRFLKGVSSVVTTTLESGSYEVKYLFSGRDLRVEDSGGNLLGTAVYSSDGFADSQTNFLATKKEGVEYYVDFHEVYDIDGETGKFVSITYTEEWNPATPGEGESWTTEPYVVTYLNDRYNNKHREGTSVEFTYDEYGDFLLVTAPLSSDSYTYTRDSRGNWTKRVDKVVFMGMDYTITDDRTVTYHPE